MTCPTCDATLTASACIHCQATGQTAGLAPPPVRRTPRAWTLVGVGAALVAGMVALGPQLPEWVAALQRRSSQLTRCTALCPGGHTHVERSVTGVGDSYPGDPLPPADALMADLAAAGCGRCEIDSQVTVHNFRSIEVTHHTRVYEPR